MEKLIRFFVGVLLLLVAAAAFVAVLDAGLRASEQEDCNKYQKWREQGHAVVPPKWCYEEGFLEESP